MAEVFTSEKWALWVQPDGPNTKPQYLGCHDLDDLAEPGGAVSLLLCFDHGDPTGYKTVGSTREPPGAVTTAVTTYIEETADYMETIDCPFPLYVNGWKCGKPDTFTNYIRWFALAHAEIGDKTLTGLARRSEDVESTQAFALTAWPPIIRGFEVEAMRQSTSETQSLNDIVFCNVAKCADECGEAQDVCDDGCAVGDADAGSPADKADVICTSDGGGTWTLVGADPFGAAEDIASIVCFYVGADTVRHLVARGTTDALNPAEIAYTDDGGVNWTNVPMTLTPGGAAAPNGQYGIGGGALFALDEYHIWFCTSGGYIYFSDDGGATWTAQEQGVISGGGNLNHVHFADESNGFCVGDTNIISRTTDGGTTWAAVTGPAAEAASNAQCVGRNTDTNIWWVGYNTATRLYFTTDNGATWTIRAFTGSGVAGGEVADISFCNDLCGWMLSNTSGIVGTVHRTRDGGYTWEAVTTPTNAGLNAIWPCSCNLAFAVGEAQGGTAVILKISGGTPS
jgi:photosystem II stability/assembly factor-like uncharacterized protein